MKAPGLAVRVAAGLEAGAFDGAASRILERIWARSASAVRPVDLPHGVPVIGVGGPTLGGSYKTPLVLALARSLARRGEEVSVVASGYGGRLRRPRRVAPDDAARDVGDEAAWLARALAPDGVAVVAGGDRADAICLAASFAPRVVVDALLQTRPVRLALSLLVVDAGRPWGAGACPPSGDLRVSRPRLLAAADRVVPVGPGDASFVESVLERADAASGSSRFIELASLGGARVGLVTAIARPERVLSSLERAGVSPAVVRRFGDHDAPRGKRRPEGGGAPELWLTTPKCATKMGADFEGADLWVLRHELLVPDALIDAAAGAEPRRAGSLRPAPSKPLGTRLRSP